MVLFLDKPSGSCLGFTYTVRTPAPFFCAFDLKKEDMSYKYNVIMNKSEPYCPGDENVFCQQGRKGAV